MFHRASALVSLPSLLSLILLVQDINGFVKYSPSFLSSPNTHRRNHVLPLSTATSRHTAEFPGDDHHHHHHHSESSSSSPAASGISSSELRHMSEARQCRYALEQASSSRFVTGDALHVLRTKVLGLRRDLQKARKRRNHKRIAELENGIWEAQQVDAEFVYQVSKERLQAAEASGLQQEAEHYRQEVALARQALPQFNLGGLWVGKYGEQGFEMINVTYVDDTLIAYKVTGDANVPKGQVSFSVDLGTPSTTLEPIELQDDAAQQWGSKFLPRFDGQGQVASRGYVNSQWLAGQLILVNQYFSFAWLPIGHQVFFGRPSAELTLKLLRQSRSKMQQDDLIRDFLERCMEETVFLDDEMEVSDTVFYSHEQEDYYNQVGCFE